LRGGGLRFSLFAHFFVSSRIKHFWHAKMARRMVQRLMVASLIVSLIVSLTGMAVAEQKRPAGLVVPSDQALAIMIKTTLITYNDANLSGNYSVLRDLASPSFREANSAAALAEIFQDMRKKNINIAPVVLFQPKLTRKPEIDADGDLVLEGFFDTRPDQVNFLIAYRAVEGLWRLFAIRVTTKTIQGAAAMDGGRSPSVSGIEKSKAK
jgi:hypothetical protein